MLSADRLKELYHQMLIKSRQSQKKLQSSTLIWDEKKECVVALCSNEMRDSGVSALKRIPWHKSLWWNKLVMISLHSPSEQTIVLAKKKHIKRVYFFENLNPAKSLQLMKKYNLEATRLVGITA